MGQCIRAQALATWRELLGSLFETTQRSAAALGIISFRDYPGVPVPPEGARELVTAHTTPEAFAALLLLVDSTALCVWIAELVRVVLAGIEDAIKQLPPAGSIAALTAFANAVDEANRSRHIVESADAAEPKARRQATVLEQLSEAIRHARQDVAKHLLGEIANTVAEYYRAIHHRDNDGDVTDAPTIDVQRSGSGTAYLRGRFNGKKVDDPRWVYSDGHLDTVGICVFLAMRRFRAQRPNDARLMVLDDIVLSIDLVHAPRVLDVLREHFSDHQILVLTHNGIFFGLFGTHLPSFKRKVITSWSLEHGPRLSDHASSIERLQDSIASSTSSKEIAMDMMALLDEWLAEARYAYSLSVQAKRGEKYTLTEIWQATRPGRCREASRRSA